MRWPRRIGWLVAMAGLLSAAPAPGGAVRSQPASRVTWRGIHTVLEMGPTCRSQLVETFEFVGEETTSSDPRWLSRTVTWSYDASCANDILVLEDVGAGTPQRVLRPWTQSCENHGAADLQATPAPSVESRCQEQPSVGYRKLSALTLPGLSWTGPRPAEDMRNGCAYNSRSRTVDGRGNVRVSTYSVTVSRGEVDAVLDVSRRVEDPYYRFVPVPGEQVRFTVRSSRPARFRFVLDPEGTSRFPGYATNASIDDAFFDNEKYALAHLRGQYANDGPDLLFDPALFPADAWSRVEPGTVETREPQIGATVTVTAMDYGAVGQLRAFAQSADCGGTWQPVPIRLGRETREVLDIPLDDDHNLMADALDVYAGMDSGADIDAEPMGNGMAGDGLTAFEEYRGFLTTQTACPEASIEHVRTLPVKKDLFIHTLDPQYAQVLTLFGWATGLHVHGICELHYVNNETRVVNFTLQNAGMRRWSSHVISQDVPQHGLRLINQEHGEAWPDGITCSDPGCIDSTAIGPPAKTYAVSVDKARFRSDAAGARARSLVRMVVHELGHAVGVPHHGDSVADWRIQAGRQNVDGPLILAPGGGCHDPAAGGDSRIVGTYFDETFVGCYMSCRLVRHGAQNSGDMSCPMRYAYGTYHEAPGSDTRYVDTVNVNRDSRGNSGRPTPASLWGGRFFLYDNDLDFPPTGRFCQTRTGTGLNDSARGDDNYAGDAPRTCVEHVVINDGVLPRERRP